MTSARNLASLSSRASRWASLAPISRSPALLPCSLSASPLSIGEPFLGRRRFRYQRLFVCVELTPFPFHVQIVGIEQSGIHQPLQARNGQAFSLQNNQLVGAQFLKRTIDMDLGETGCIRKV